MKINVVRIVMKKSVYIGVMQFVSMTARRKIVLKLNFLWNADFMEELGHE